MVLGFVVGYVILNVSFIYGVSSDWALYLISLVMGFNYMAVPSYFVVYGAQIAFPVDQASVAGYLFAISQTFGFILGLVLIPFINGTK